MAGTWFCLKCYKNMGDKEYCPYCGAHRLGDMAMSKKEAESVLKNFLEEKLNGSNKVRQFFQRKNVFYTAYILMMKCIVK